MDALLRLELGQGIDAQRMLTEVLYARDVLLVCDAHADNDLQALAQHFRAAVADTSEDGGQPTTQSGLASEFKSSRPDSAPGPLTAPSAQGAQAAQPGRWFSPSRWLTK